MFERAADTLLERLAKQYNLSSAGRALLEIFVEAPPEAQKAIANYVLEAADRIARYRDIEEFSQYGNDDEEEKPPVETSGMERPA